MNNNISTIGFNGEFLEPNFENYDLGNGYRAYNPMIMQFTAPDDMSPFGEGGLNPYMYCIGDPINRADPTGHFSVFGFAIGMAMGAFSLNSLVISGVAIISGDIAAGGMTLGAIYGIYASIKQMDEAAHRKTQISYQDFINFGSIFVAEVLGYGTGKLLRFAASKVEPLDQLAVKWEGVAMRGQKPIHKLATRLTYFRRRGVYSSEWLKTDLDMIDLRMDLRTNNYPEPPLSEKVEEGGRLLRRHYNTEEPPLRKASDKQIRRVLRQRRRELRNQKEWGIDMNVTVSIAPGLDSIQE